MDIIPYDRRYENGVLKLLKKGLNPNFSRERFEWLHYRNPMAPSDILIAMDGRKVVGFRAVIKKRIKIGDVELIGGRDIDSTLYPEYRGKGIFSELIDRSLRDFSDVDVYFTFSNHLSAPVFMHHGWRKLDFRRMVYCVSPPALSALYMGGIYSRLLCRCRRIPANGREIQIYDFEFQTAREPEFPIRVCKDRDYFLWRYEQNPDKVYRYFALRDNGEDLALLVCSSREKWGTEVLLVLDVYNQSSFSNKEILAAFFDFLQKRRFRVMVDCWGQSARDLGKVMTGVKTSSFYVREAPGTELPVDVYDVSNWYMVPGEAEYH